MEAINSISAYPGGTMQQFRFVKGRIDRGLLINKRVVILVLVIGGILSSSVRAGDSNTDSGNVEKESTVSEKTIEQVQDAHTKEWMSIPGVEGTGIGLCEGKPCIKIFSSKTAEELKGRIPATIEGYPVTIEETGTFRALE